jgi:hypothetical protein
MNQTKSLHTSRRIARNAIALRAILKTPITETVHGIALNVASLNNQQQN